MKKKVLLFFASAVVALLCVSACSSDDDEIDTSDCYTCTFIYDNQTEVIAYVKDTPPAYNPAATNSEGVPAPAKGDQLYFFHVKLNGRQFNYGDALKLRILSYRLDDTVHLASRETRSNDAEPFRSFLCDVELVE